MEAFLKALTFLKETKEYKLQGLIFEHIGYLNLGQGMYEQSIDNYRKSIHYYELAGDSIGEVYGCRNVARGTIPYLHTNKHCHNLGLHNAPGPHFYNHTPLLYYHQPIRNNE